MACGWHNRLGDVLNVLVVVVVLVLVVFLAVFAEPVLALRLLHKAFGVVGPIALVAADEVHVINVVAESAVGLRDVTPAGLAKPIAYIRLVLVHGELVAARQPRRVGDQAAADVAESQFQWAAEDDALELGTVDRARAAHERVLAYSPADDALAAELVPARYKYVLGNS